MCDEVVFTCTRHCLKLVDRRVDHVTYFLTKREILSWKWGETGGPKPKPQHPEPPSPPSSLWCAHQASVAAYSHALLFLLPAQVELPAYSWAHLFTGPRARLASQRIAVCRCCLFLPVEINVLVALDPLIFSDVFSPSSLPVPWMNPRMLSLPSVT